MTERRFLINLPIVPTSLPETVEVCDAFVIDHLTKVLRLKNGTTIIAVDTSHQVAYRAILKTISKQSVSLTLISVESPPSHNLPKLTLAASVIKETHWEWLLQKATELGVSKIIPLQSQFSEIRPRMLRIERWQSIVTSAAQQSEGLFVPKISELTTLNDFLNGIANAEQFSIHPSYVLQERAEKMPYLADALQSQNELAIDSEITLLVGPEGGWHMDELARFKTHPTIKPVSLGNRILRAETAAVAAVAITQHALQFGWNKKTAAQENERP